MSAFIYTEHAPCRQRGSGRCGGPGWRIRRLRRCRQSCARRRIRRSQWRRCQTAGDQSCCRTKHVKPVSYNRMHRQRCALVAAPPKVHRGRRPDADARCAIRAIPNIKTCTLATSDDARCRRTGQRLGQQTRVVLEVLLEVQSCCVNNPCNSDSDIRKHDQKGGAPEGADVGGGGPGGVHDDGVHPRRHEEGVEDVGLELGALRNGARHDGAGRCRELLQAMNLASGRAQGFVRQH